MNYATEIRENEELLLQREKDLTNAKLRDKIKLLRFLKMGKNLREASSLIGVSYRQAQRYITIYRQQGLDELVQLKYKANAAKLQEPHIEQLRQYVSKHANELTLLQLKKFIADNFSKNYTLGGISSLLKRHNIQY